jgi:hypothetical protein
MHAVIARYLGPTDFKGARISYHAHGYPRRIVARDYSAEYDDQVVLDAEGYACEVLEYKHPQVIGPADTSDSESVVLIEEGPAQE